MTKLITISLKFIKYFNTSFSIKCGSTKKSTFLIVLKIIEHNLKKLTTTIRFSITKNGHADSTKFSHTANMYTRVCDYENV